MKKQKIKLSIGTVFQKAVNGTYYFRYQINDRRKQISLKTKNKEIALKNAKEIIPLLKASSTEVIAAHVQNAKGWSKKQERLELSRIWEVYSQHPDRVRPKSQKIWSIYESYLNEFLTWLRSQKKYSDVIYMDQIRDLDEYGNKLDQSIVFEYSEYLRSQEIAVDTHNKKISRPATIFKTLSKYLDVESPWENRKLRRSPKEESHTEHRRPFPADKELAMFEALKPGSEFNPTNKEELEVLLHILKFTGQRQKDCVNLSWNKVDLDARRLKVKQEKTGRDVSIPIAQELHDILLRAKEWEVNEYVLPKCAKRYAAKSPNGIDVGVDLINKQLLNIIKHVGLEPSVKVAGRKKKLTVYGVHSFRHGFASFCAENNVPSAVCASILGADSSIIQSYYVTIGEESQRRVIDAISASTNKLSDKDRIKNALDYIDNLPNRSKELFVVKKLLNANE